MFRPKTWFTFICQMTAIVVALNSCLCHPQNGIINIATASKITLLANGNRKKERGSRDKEEKSKEKKLSKTAVIDGAVDQHKTKSVKDKITAHNIEKDE